MRLQRGRGQGTAAFKSLFITKPRAGAVSLCDKSVPKQGLAYPKQWQGAVLNRRDPRKPPGSGGEVFQPLEWGMSGTRPVPLGSSIASPA